ncbi:hypothetical protein Ppb6_02884 [Photorhabdus australis subsp. thailandensis]|uniref:Uncharacterized protein n=2 Tax=Photorhabdus australis TaxID=286156 RepID=A0A1C0U1I7_9GAMM|nr:hypothetical protein Ppb6_02884 [Photorhabdus australis subsp. thailandensis]
MMVNYMKLNMLFALILTALSFSAYAEKIDYCYTIEFDSGVFNLKSLKKASAKNDCRYNLVPLVYNGVKDYFNLSGAAYPSGGIGYIKWDDVSKKYSYDIDEINNSLKDSYGKNNKFNYVFNMKYKVEIKTFPRRKGAMVMSDVIFLDKKDKPYSVMRTLFFYSQDNYAAEYYPDPIKYSDKKRIDFLNKVTDLFMTMAINCDFS